MCGVSGLFSSIVFSTSLNKKKAYLSDREASLIKKEYCRCGPHPLQVIFPELDHHLSSEWAALAPFSQISGVGHSGSWPPLHCGDPKTLHRRLFLVPHCTLRLSHLSVRGNARRLEIVGQLDM